MKQDLVLDAVGCFVFVENDNNDDDDVIVVVNDDDDDGSNGLDDQMIMMHISHCDWIINIIFNISSNIFGFTSK